MTFARSTYDVIIAGGGPAGCAAAISARRACLTAEILLLEKGGYPRHKVCGEFVSPEALDLLSSLVGTTESVTSVPRIQKAQVLVGNSKIDVPLRPAAISLARYQLDALLWVAAQHDGVECVSAAVTQVTGLGDGFQVQTGNGSVHGRVVINASGRWSNLSMPVESSTEKWIGLKAHFAEHSPDPSVSLYFFAGGYCGVQAVGDDSVNACAMVKADVAKDLDAVLEQHPALRSRSRSWTPLTETFATSPLLFRPPRATQDGMFLVGDAAGFIDPFLGDGISLALRSGSMAGILIAEVAAGRMTREVARAQYSSAYQDYLAPAFRRAARLRWLLTMPSLFRVPMLNLARLPGVAELVFRRTRPAA